jgi:hypothetical protein
MKTITLMMIAVLTSLSLGGCIVHTHSRSHAVHRRDCPPAHHWDGRGCVHNGRARGHHR